jgi:hypothetical protein
MAILFLGIATKTYSQNFWEQVYFPDSSSIFSICLSEQDIYIASGAGVYRSLDNGTSWNMLGLGHRIIHSVAVNTNGDIYAGTSQDPGINEGLYRSTDKGGTWEVVLPDIGVYGNIVKVLTHGDTIFASLWMGGARVIRTMDNCQTWDLVFATENTSEYVSDLLLGGNNELYISLKAYMDNMGGVHKSSDWGDTWEYSGLFNHSVSSLAKNSSDDIFAGSWGYCGPEGWWGLYVLRNGQSLWDTLTWGPQVADVVVNTDENIFISVASPSTGVMRSEDDGQTFEIFNHGLPVGSGMGDMEINNEGFIYLSSTFLSNYLAKSINTTVNIPKITLPNNNSYTVCPNPVTDIMYIRPKKNECYTDNILLIKIYNTRGELVFSRKTNPTQNIMSIDLNELASGLYMLEITYRNISSHLKIIKQ